MGSYQLTRIVSSFVNDNLNYPSSTRIQALTSTPTQVGSTGTLTFYGYSFVNDPANAFSVYVKIYDRATAPTVGVNIPVMTIQVPQSGSAVLYGAEVVLYITLGMWVACVQEATDGGTTAPTQGIITQLNYKQ